MRSIIPNPDIEADFDVTIVVRNGRLRASIQRAGYETAKEFAEACGISRPTLSQFLRLALPPFNQKGKLRPSAEQLTAFLGRTVEELFPASALTNAFVTNSVTVGMSENQVAALIDSRSSQALLEAPQTPEQEVARSQGAEALLRAIESLHNPRLRRVICMRFGIDPYDREHTIDEVAEAFNVSRERIRQMEMTAVRRLRDPKLLREGGLAGAAAAFDIKLRNERPETELQYKLRTLSGS